MLDKTYRPADVEKQQVKMWEDAGVFTARPESERDPYCIVIPPPNVTGSLHMGHALNFTLQDILVRYQRMCGQDVLWQPGTDHAGMAPQMVVERRLAAEGISRHDLGREEFVRRVWEWKEHSGGTITRQMRRLGTSVDWPRERFTMDDGLSKAVREVFVSLYKEGLIYRDKRLVNWDPKLRTAISDLEVEQRETTGKMWYFRYPVEGEENRYLTVGTTRPETMLGDTAVAVHEEDERYRDLLGKNCILPIMNRPIPIVADPHADPEKGTGAVKITPAHDFDDFEVGRRHNLEMINILDETARLNENTPQHYQGLKALEARENIVREMNDLGLLERVEDNLMVIPYGDRSGEIVEPWLTDQWFVDAKTLAGPAIEAVESGKVKFVPENWANTYFEWMRNIQPWCISRQLWWGHRVPVWYGPDGKIFCEKTQEEAEVAAREHYGKDVPLEREEDVLDTWFSSGLWPFSTLGWPEETPELKKYYPTDVLVTGFDIIFFWVARMMMMGMHFMKTPPFHTVYIHALVRDEHGRKMSKSKGNVVDPLELMEEYGADALRFTMAAMAAQGRDVLMSESRVQGYRNFATKLWNAARFCQINDCRPDPDFVPEAVKNPLNRWLVSKVAAARSDVAAGIEAYKFNEASNAVYHFVWNTFCDWGVEYAKPVLNSSDEAAAAETRATLAWVLDRILEMLHPFMPYITEELWGQLDENRDDLLAGRSWTDLEGLRDGESESRIDWLSGLITEIRSARSEMNVPPGRHVPLYIQGAGEWERDILSAHGALAFSLARLEKIDYLASEDEVPHGAIQVVFGALTLILPLADIIDVEQETDRLSKELEKIEGELSKLEKKLANENFLSRAPGDVVEKQRRRRDEAERDRTRVADALARMRQLV